jgi:AcrR family transcriptional regulator
MTKPSSVSRRTGRPAKHDVAPGQDAATMLLHAAGAEFVEYGYANTSTHRIAKRAGFAPQTFYRWFTDKLEIFVKVMLAWADAELTTLETMLTEQAGSAQIAEVWVQSHRSFILFKRGVRQLAQETPEIRQARADSRRAQIQRAKHWRPQLTDEEIATLLIGIETLCEVLAEDEFDDLHLTGKLAYAELAAMIDRLRPRRQDD